MQRRAAHFRGRIHIVHPGAVRMILILWLGSAAMPLALIYRVTPRAADVLARMDMLDASMPALTDWLFCLGAALHAPMGIVSAASGLLATSVPYLLGARGRVAAYVYAFGILVALLAVFVTWFGLVRPLDIAEQELVNVPVWTMR